MYRTINVLNLSHAAEFALKFFDETMILCSSLGGEVAVRGGGGYLQCIAALARPGSAPECSQSRLRGHGEGRGQCTRERSPASIQLILFSILSQMIAGQLEYAKINTGVSRTLHFLYLYIQLVLMLWYSYKRIFCIIKLSYHILTVFLFLKNVIFKNKKNNNSSEIILQTEILLFSGYSPPFYVTSPLHK